MGRGATLRTLRPLRAARGGYPLPWSHPLPENDGLSDRVTAIVNRTESCAGNVDVAFPGSDARPGAAIMASFPIV